ncbi:MAG: hypothetical protein GXO10_06425 [Crenarchaeota archaeon]|nr:hypothetical protein [Thermoproteota archaeon]
MSEKIEKLVETAHRLYMEAIALLDKDPVQASEKLYKVVENCIKILAILYNIEEYEIAKKEGTWWSKLLARSAHKLSKLLNNDTIVRAWQAGFDLHVYGFHEEAYTQQEVKNIIPIVEDLLNLTLRIFNYSK